MSGHRNTADQVNDVSDPARESYDPSSPVYLLSADPSSPYYVGPVVPVVRSAEQTRAEITQVVDLDNAGELVQICVAPESRDREINDRLAAASASQSQALAKDVGMRNSGAAPATMWESASHEHMTAVMATANGDPIAQGADGWRGVSNTLGDHHSGIARQISASMPKWVGAGGDAARTRMAHLAQWVGTTARGAGLSAQQQETQASSVSDAKRAMDSNPPVPFSAAEYSARLQQTSNPLVFAATFMQEQEQYNKHQAAQELAARTMTSFDGQMGGAAATPTFPEPPPPTDAPSASRVPLARRIRRAAVNYKQLSGTRRKTAQMPRGATCQMTAPCRPVRLTHPAYPGRGRASSDRKRKPAGTSFLLLHRTTGRTQPRPSRRKYRLVVLAGQARGWAFPATLARRCGRVTESQPVRAAVGSARLARHPAWAEVLVFVVESPRSERLAPAPDAAWPVGPAAARVQAQPEAATAEPVAPRPRQVSKARRGWARLARGVVANLRTKGSAGPGI